MLADSRKTGNVWNEGPADQEPAALLGRLGGEVPDSPPGGGLPSSSVGPAAQLLFQALRPALEFGSLFGVGHGLEEVSASLDRLAVLGHGLQGLDQFSRNPWAIWGRRESLPGSGFRPPCNSPACSRSFRSRRTCGLYPDRAPEGTSSCSFAEASSARIRTGLRPNLRSWRGSVKSEKQKGIGKGPHTGTTQSICGAITCQKQIYVLRFVGRHVLEILLSP